jgi:TolB-like protein
VIVVYATAAFVILELVNNVFEPLRLPEWTPTLVIIILLVGFPLAVIFSWIFDVTPEGIEKTKPSKEIRKEDRTGTPNSWRIATYISVVIILGLLAFNIFGGNNKVKIDETLAKSIAVLPFYNLSGDLEREYICDGLTDEIISNLFKVKSFDKVVSFSSVLSYKDHERNIPMIADELGVNYILEGSYKRMGDELKITAQLIEPRSDNHLWLKDYQLTYKEVPGIPGEIALQIADHLKAFILNDEEKSINMIPTDNLEAYELIQQVRSLYNKSAFGYLDSIIDLADKALELDPNYADAYAFKGNMIFSEGLAFGSKEMKSVAWEAERYFEKALKIDSFNVMANWGMVSIYYMVKWDYIKVEEYALQFQNWVNSDVNVKFGWQSFYKNMGMYEKARSFFADNSFSSMAIQNHILMGNTQYARDLINKKIEEYGSLPINDSELYLWLQEFDSALYTLESHMEISDPSSWIPRFQAFLAVAYYKTGHRKEAQDIISQLIQKSDTTSVGHPAFYNGYYYSWIGEIDSAFYWLEKAVENRSPGMRYLKTVPAFNSLKDDPRYWDLYERTGHKAYDDYMASKEK